MLRMENVSNKIKMIKNKKGFTLVEMLLAVAVLMLLSGAILVSVSSQREKARATRMLTELSGTIQPVYMCLADGGLVNSPSGGTGGGNICSLSANYGSWPVRLSGFSSYVASNSGNFSANTWYVYLNGNGARICCNAHLSGCEKLTSGSTCNSSTP